MGKGEKTAARDRARVVRCAIAAILLALVTGIAAAQGDSPTPPLDQTLDIGQNNEQVPDTDYTPKYKQGDDYWKQVAGAVFPANAGDDPKQLLPSSVTSYDDNLFTVSFRNDKEGFAGGATCSTPDPDAEAGCKPALFHFTDTRERGPVWDRVDLPGQDAAGFIGAIAWSSDGTEALAVGGDGTYPRRDLARRDGESYADWVARDPAGHARAWFYKDGQWSDLSDELSSDMRGLTAVAFDKTPGQDFAFAGALGQMWMWRNGQFTEHVDSQSDPSKLQNPRLFLYRVRAVQFVLPGTGPNQHPLTREAFAVTAGCCESNQLQATPALLAYDGQWHARSFGLSADDSVGIDASGKTEVGTDNSSAVVNRRQELPDSYYSLLAVLSAPPRKSKVLISSLASPGGPRADGERPSVMSELVCKTPEGTDGDVNSSVSAMALGNREQMVDEAGDLLGTSASTARFVAAGGDTANTHAPYLTWSDESGELGKERIGSGRPTTSGNPACDGGAPEGYPGDAVPDWAVGELRSTWRPGYGSRALVLGLGLKPGLAPDTINTAAPDPNHPGDYQPTSPEAVQRYPQSAYFLLRSYTLNAIDVRDDTGTGWAVGDHGAIEELSQARLNAARPEPAPGAVGQPQASQNSNTGAYDAYRPLAQPTATSAVPPLGAQPLESLSQPQLFPFGSPDAQVRDPFEDVSQIVMSRDGNEGWAVGPNAVHKFATAGTTAMTLYHYDGLQWSRCDMVGVAGQLPADPACASLRPLYDAGVTLRAAARVPLEKDSDPSNDDDFEVVAVGSTYDPNGSSGAKRQAVVRYKDGHWALDPASNSVVANPVRSLQAVAFTAPDDGWALTDDVDDNALFHFDGTSWVNCATAADHCDDPGDNATRRTFFRAAGSNGQTQGFRVPLADVVRGLTAVGDRVYLFGTRADQSSGTKYPLAIYHERGKQCQQPSDAGCWRAAGGGLDPLGDAAGGQVAGGAMTGEVDSMGLVRQPSGSYEGWVVGDFGGTPIDVGGVLKGGARDTRVMRIKSDGTWTAYHDPGGPLDDYVEHPYVPDDARIDPRNATEPLQMVAPDPGGGEPDALMAVPGTGRILRYDRASGHWTIVPGGRPMSRGGFDADGPDGAVQALAPDGAGGAWVAVANEPARDWTIPSTQERVYFYHYTAHPPKPVFNEVPNPAGQSPAVYTALAGAPDGSLWLGTDGSTLFRYDRMTGWDRVDVKGWDPGRIVTKSSRVNAVAVASDGSGVAVGAGGRIADISGAKVTLDPVAGVRCAAGTGDGCTTGYDLRSAAVAPDGSALAGGDHMSLLWRPANGRFQSIQRPAAPPSQTITGLAFPAPDHAWLATDGGLVFAGTQSNGNWSWNLENVTASGDVLALDKSKQPIPLRAIAVGADGKGFAVGDQGLVLERSGNGGEPWTRLRTGFTDDLTSIALAPGDSLDAVVGGHNGLLLTSVKGHFEMARPADYFGSPSYGVFNQLTGPVVGVAVLPGVKDGQVEAWAAIRGRAGATTDDPENGVNELLHYTSDPGESLLNPTGRAAPLPDVPAPRPGELSFAAFGETGCKANGDETCTGVEGTTMDNDLISRLAVQQIASDAGQPNGPAFALFTGDASDSARLPASQAVEDSSVASVPRSSIEPNATPSGRGAPNFDGPMKLRRWREQVAGTLAAANVPLFGAIGGRDLSDPRPCQPNNAAPQSDCFFTGQRVNAKAGENSAWRTSFAGMEAPWGRGNAPAGPMTFTPVGDSGTRLPNDAGARTHYAADAERGGKPVLRIAVIDTSLRGLSTSDPEQSPLESSGQLTWLDNVLSSRPEGEPAVVVSSTPTYSYGPGALTETQSDATTLEAVLLKDRVTAVVSGRVGWNGLYFATAPGIHVPCPGGAYPDSTPAPDSRTCDQGVDSGTSATRVAAALRSLGAPPPPDPTGTTDSAHVTGVLPFVIAASAGSHFGPDGDDDGSAGSGFWHGYTTVRVDPSGDPAKLIVEQRPLFDWITIRAIDHTLHPGQKLTLKGFGREPISLDSRFGQPTPHVVRYDAIDSPAITHRYDLLEADPEKPWLPKVEEGNGNPHGYVPLDPSVATVDPQSGAVFTGRGSHGRIYAIALLSVGNKAATWPLVFEPRRSFKQPPARVIAVPPAVPSIRVLGLAAQSVPSQAPPSAPQTPPISAELTFPAPPALPGLPGVAAPPIAPPAPPAPPPPPAQQAPVGLNLTATPVGLTIPPPSSPIPPPAPPINPAPPGGARKEARQRQAATAKSEEGASENARDAAGDLAQGPMPPTAAQMVRRDRMRAEPGSLTPLPHHSQPSAWVTSLEWGGGIGLMALALALGFTGVRPTPRRRTPTVPAPAWARRRR